MKICSKNFRQWIAIFGILVTWSAHALEPVSLPIVYQGITFNHAFRFKSVDGVLRTCYFSTIGDPPQSQIQYPTPFIGIESRAMYSPNDSCSDTYLALNVRLLAFYTSPPFCSDGSCGPAIMACPLNQNT